MKPIPHYIFHKIRLSLLVICILSSASFAQEIQIVTNDFPPYSYIKNGKITGLATEVLQEILIDLKMDIEIRQYPWARAYEMATTERNVLIYPLARSPEREGVFHFIGEVAPRVMYLYKLKTRKDIQIKSIEDLKKYTHGVVNHYAAHYRLMELGVPNIETVVEDIQNIHKLAFGRIDLYTQDEIVFLHNIRNYNENNDPKLKFLDFERAFEFPSEGKGRTLSFGPVTDNDIVKKFQKSFEKIKASGRLDAIKLKYIK